MNSYLCANRHHFRSLHPTCPSPGCEAEVRPTAMHPSTDGSVPAFEKLRRLPRGSSPATGGPSAAPEEPKHSIRWWAYDNQGTRYRSTSGMIATLHNWDVTCSCGWDSNTGGQPVATVRALVKGHKA